jgi:alkylated DNA repair dioxygenase AlkB
MQVCKTPRLQAWMADIHTSPSIYSNSKALPWDKQMLTLKERIESVLSPPFIFDYVLMNLYRNGEDYISFHSDKEAIGESQNVIASVSLGETRRFIIKHNSKDIKHEFELQSGSLLLMMKQTQKFWKHSVPKQKSVSNPRLNLTFRRS